MRAIHLAWCDGILAHASDFETPDLLAHAESVMRRNHDDGRMVEIEHPFDRSRPYSVTFEATVDLSGERVPWRHEFRLANEAWPLDDGQDHHQAHGNGPVSAEEREMDHGDDDGATGAERGEG